MTEEPPELDWPTVFADELVAHLRDADTKLRRHDPRPGATVTTIEQLVHQSASAARELTVIVATGSRRISEGPTRDAIDPPDVEKIRCLVRAWVGVYLTVAEWQRWVQGIVGEFGATEIFSRMSEIAGPLRSGLREFLERLTAELVAAVDATRRGKPPPRINFSFTARLDDRASADVLAAIERAVAASGRRSGSLVSGSDDRTDAELTELREITAERFSGRTALPRPAPQLNVGD